MSVRHQRTTGANSQRIQRKGSGLPRPSATVTDKSGALTINTRAAAFSFTKSELSLKGTPFEVSSGGSTYRAVPSSSGWTVEERGPMKVVVRVEGGWNKTLANTLNRFRARLVFYRDKSYVRAFLTFRNNNSFGWDPSGGAPRVDDLVLTGATFGISLLAAGGSYVFGSGVEKTWEMLVPQTGSPVLQDSRYTSKGILAAGYKAPRPLAAAQPQYYASTKAWGLITPPLTGFPSDQQADFDLFERIQHAKVIQKDVQNPPNTRGITLWEHLNQDIRSWNDYGDIRWGGDCAILGRSLRCHRAQGVSIHLHVARMLILTSSRSMSSSWSSVRISPSRRSRVRQASTRPSIPRSRLEFVSSRVT